MSREPRTQKLDAQELLKFLDQLAAETSEEQRAQLSFASARAAPRERDDANGACSLSVATPPTHPFATARPGKAAPALELTMLDAERRLDEEVSSARWLRPAGRRLAVVALGAAATFALLAYAGLPSHVPVGAGAARQGPPPLPRAPRVAAASARIAPSAANAAAGPRAANFIAETTPAANIVAGRAARHAERPAAERAGRQRSDQQPAPPDRATDDKSARARSADARSEIASPSARRKAVDLLLSGHTRAALDAYRALSSSESTAPALREVVRLLEGEQRACSQQGGAPCEP